MATHQEYMNCDWMCSSWREILRIGWDRIHYQDRDRDRIIVLVKIVILIRMVNRWITMCNIIMVIRIIIHRIRI
jgi:hypothetical protein